MDRRIYKPRSKLYWVWGDMIGRCTNPNHASFANYGGRGITVCDRWRSSAAFIADMSPRPDGGMLDRTDNNAGYSPENCRWATRQEQNSNRRNCIRVTLDGDDVVLKEACRRLGISYRAILKRVRRKWPMREALTIPVGTGKHAHSFNAVP